ncbi:MAG: primosomal protein DnaI [Bacillaceae bacterium]|uniref:primosomal protein DnaI n=1 Tax=Aeribacillus TaxID=1055323 RepID=UPI000E394238|nr:primosomal protein DnaI [Aeribacillus composti]MED1437165.1 primosomal protein DnaI [Aeribacillus composti]REJ20723.1 MAG: primosomal protein DnaI [Bacillaceae bacterium]
MESLQNHLKQFMNSKGFRETYLNLKQQIKSDKDVRLFLEKHKDQIDENMIDRSLGKLYEFVTQSKFCRECRNLDECKNILKGYHPTLIIERKTIDLKYDKCPRKEAYDARKKQESLIKCMYVPKEILNAHLEDIDLNEPNRLKAVSLVQDFVEQYGQNDRLKGLYLYGSFGVGKTFILGAIANELAEKGVPSMLVYVPEFVRELKSALQDHSLNEKIDAVKKIPVLMLDDIGAESMSSWMRDDILGSILQFRMLENLPTFFTSNFNFSELEHHLTYSQKGEIEQLKAKRIMERIRFLAIPVELKGKNRRQE